MNSKIDQIQPESLEYRIRIEDFALITNDVNPFVYDAGAIYNKMYKVEENAHL